MRSPGGTPRPKAARSMFAAAVLVVATLVAATAPGQPGAAAASYVSLPTSARLVDTRPGAVTVDGLNAGTGLRPAGSTYEVQVTGRAGVPADTPAVALTVTAVDSAAAGFLTVHATGTTQPNTSNVNYYQNHNTAGTVIARLSADGKVSIYTSAATQLIVDVAGYFPAGSYSPLAAPVRLTDTRLGATTIDGQSAGIGLRAAGSTLEVQVAGRGGVPIDASTVVLNVTAVDEAGTGFLTVYATGPTRPNSSNVNFYADHNMANTVITSLGTDGKISIYTSAATHLIVDVAGSVPAATLTSLSAPTRLADTRPTGTTIDGQHAALGRVGGGYSMQLDVAGRGGVPVDASAAVLTVAAVDPYGTGYSTVFPAGTSLPNASNVNYYAAHNTANTVIVPIGAEGDVCIFASSATDFVVDVSGYLPANGPVPAPADAACPQPTPIVAVWPAHNVVFDTPQAAAADFVRVGVGVDPLLGPFVPGGSLRGEIEVYSPLDDDDPSTVRPTGTILSMRRLGADLGWFVLSATSDGVTITSPVAGATVAAGPVTVEGLARGFEANVLLRAFVAGVAPPPLDSTFTGTDWMVPSPYSVSLDVSAAEPGDVVALLTRGDTGLENDPSEFAAVPILIAG